MTGLPKDQDAYGHGVLDFLQGAASGEVVERDDGLVEPDVGPGGYFTGYKDWSSAEKKALRYVRGRVLDVGAGAGRVALHLQQRGHEVVAIDNSPLAVKVCLLRGVKDARVVPFTQISRKLGTFDTIVMLGNNFGLFGSYARAKWMLRRLKGITTPDARIIAQTLDPYKTEDPDHLAYHRLNRRRGRMAGQLKIRVRYRKHATPWFDYLFVSEKEMRQILRDTGWHLGRTVEDCPRYVAVIERER